MVSTMSLILVDEKRGGGGLARGEGLTEGGGGGGGLVLLVLCGAYQSCRVGRLFHFQARPTAIFSIRGPGVADSFNPPKNLSPRINLSGLIYPPYHKTQDLAPKFFNRV